MLSNDPAKNQASSRQMQTNVSHHIGDYYTKSEQSDWSIPNNCEKTTSIGGFFNILLHKSPQTPICIVLPKNEQDCMCQSETRREIVFEY